MKIRELTARQVTLVGPCLEGLAAYHNSIGSAFSGAYPTLSNEWTLDRMYERLQADAGLLCAAFEGEEVVGCVYASVVESVGMLDILYVAEEARGRGYGDALMQKALEFFGEQGVDIVDIRVVEGNPAARFYEKYGFKTRALVMSKLAK